MPANFAGLTRIHPPLWFPASVLVRVGPCPSVYVVPRQRQRELEQERSRIARDIHDELGAGLTRIGLLVDEAVRTTGPAHPAWPHVAQAVAMTRDLVRY